MTTKKDSKKPVEEQSQTNELVQSKPKRSFPIVSLLLISGFAFIGYVYYPKPNSLQRDVNTYITEQQQFKKRIEQQAEELSVLAKNQSEFLALFELQLAQKDVEIENLDRQITTLQNKFPSLPIYWRLYEIEHLIMLAKQKWDVEKQKQSAIDLLLSAQSQINKMENPDFNPILVGLKRDILNLQQSDTHQKESVIYQINKMILAVDKIQVVKESELIPHQDLDFNANILNSLKTFLSELVIIERKSTTPSITQNDVFYIKENIKHHLLFAVGQVLSHNNELINQHLEISQNMLQSNFSHNIIAQQILNNIKGLKDYLAMLESEKDNAPLVEWIGLEQLQILLKQHELKQMIESTNSIQERTL